MTDKNFSKLGDVLPSVLKQLGLEKKFRERQILTFWPEVVGDEIAARTEATHIDDGVLYVRVDPGAWMQELHFIERQLVARLKSKAPTIKLNQIRFTTRETL